MCFLVLRIGDLFLDNINNINLFGWNLVFFGYCDFDFFVFFCLFGLFNFNRDGGGMLMDFNYFMFDFCCGWGLGDFDFDGLGGLV